MVTQEDYNRIEYLIDKWKGLQSSGNLSLSHTEKQDIAYVYNKIFNKSFCLHCPAEIFDAFTKVFQQFDKQQPTERIKRKRNNTT